MLPTDSELVMHIFLTYLDEVVGYAREQYFKDLGEARSSQSSLPLQR